ncbi:glutaredoxin domain-containing protein [Nocardia salmonicida]|uniref:glutaredoxin domain-containing protein n=1 Tax=Nocardia salmonicida TaxID=53431 RepID=UPI0007A4BFB0|nr:glutaredoxin domain-containing protein [Nocardia salmonicida]
MADTSASRASFARITRALDEWAFEHNRLPGPASQRGQWTMYCCPAHEDTDPSLGLIHNKDKAKTVVRCFTGCPDTQVLAAIGLPGNAIWDRQWVREPGTPPRPRPPRPESQPEQRSARDPAKPSKKQRLGKIVGPRYQVATYLYTDQRGLPLGEVVRIHVPHERGIDKMFFQRRVDAGGRWHKGGFAPALYRLPEVAQAIADGEEIFLVEGEKDVERARGAGLVATCNAMGAGAFWRAHARQLAGAARVVIVADRDEAGYRHAAEVQRLLIGLVREVVVVEAATGKDLSDHFDLGHDIDELVPVTDTQLDQGFPTAHAILAEAENTLEGAFRRSFDPETGWRWVWVPEIGADYAIETAATHATDNQQISEPAMPQTETPPHEGVEITVYTKPQCPQCDATKRTLDNLGFAYRVVDVAQDPDARERLLSMGFRGAPVVEAGNVRFTGFRPDKLKSLSGVLRADVVAEQEAAAVQPGFRHPGAADRLSVEAVQKWAAPYLRSAQRRGEIPELGSPQWASLPNGDPRKTGAVVEAAVRYVRQASAPEPAASPSRSRGADVAAARGDGRRPTFAALQEARRGEQSLRAASGPLTPIATTTAFAGTALPPAASTTTTTAPHRSLGRGR